MNIHILNGDSLANNFSKAGIDGDIIICRECLMDGPVKSQGLFSFWKSRAAFIQKEFNESEEGYYRKVKAELDKIDRLPADTFVHLWFENDLFCQVNMWFIISLLNKKNLQRVFRICPLDAPHQRTWSGFGLHAPVDLRICWDEKAVFTQSDFRLGEHLWNAYSQGNLEALRLLSQSSSPCFPMLKEVCLAEIERKTQARPETVLKEIMAMGYTDFEEIFHRFNEREGIYGYGDLQVGQMIKNISVN